MSKFKKVLKIAAKVAPAVLPFTPLGPVAGALVGGALGGLSGGGLKGALLGAASGGLGANGFAGAQSLVKGTGLASGLSAAGLKGIGGALAGGVGGLASGGGLKGALLGSATGGVGGYISGAGGVSNALSNFGVDSYGAIEKGGMLGKALEFGDSLTGAGSAAKGITGAPLADTVAGAGTGAGASTYGKAALAGNLLSSVNSSVAQDEAKDELLKGQANSMEALSPYLQNGQASNERLAELLGLSGDPNSEGYGSLGETFNPDKFMDDPGYQFSKEQGEAALNASLGARGKVFSGDAIREGTQFATGLANQSYNDAYNRWRASQQDVYNRYATQSAAGQNAANSAADIYDNQGNIRANSTIAQSNILNSTLSSILSGQGARQIIGYKPDGTPIYAEDQTQSVNA